MRGVTGLTMVTMLSMVSWGGLRYGRGGRALPLLGVVLGVALGVVCCGTRSPLTMLRTSTGDHGKHGKYGKPPFWGEVRTN